MASKRTQTSSKKGRKSPAMLQFFRAKEAYPDAILFFRMGDFYEMFFEDAVLASQLLDISLTSRGTDEHGVAIPMAGVPHHAASGYVARLIELGKRVAICEQMADPSQVKGVVPREVVRVVTPGLVLDEDALDARSHNYLAAVAECDGAFGLAVLELSTSEVRATTVPQPLDLAAELVRLDPREVLLCRLDGRADELRSLLPRASFVPLSASDVVHAEESGDFAEVLAEAAQRDEEPLSAPGLLATRCALGYAQRSQPRTRLPISRIAPYDPSRQLVLDDVAVRNLELVKTLSGERRGSLLHLLDVTKSPMGARLLRHRLLSPLTALSPIRRRHDQVARLVEDAPLREGLRQQLGHVGDLERLATRASLGVATPRDLGSLRNGLAATQTLVALLRESTQEPRPGEDPLVALVPEDSCEDVVTRLESELMDEPPVAAANGGIFRDSTDVRIAELRELSASSKDVILRLEAEERERTGIPTLKIRYTKVFGYYIEISKAKLAAVPDDYRRKQTVASGERFTTATLDELQQKIVNADERLRTLEQERFEVLRADIGQLSPRLRRLAQRLADVDVHAAFAELAHRYDYVRPTVNDSERIELRDARHPIVERNLPAGTFVPNDIALDTEGERLMIITGPNMSGKSTCMRQVALSVIIAQAGGFVPAASANLGVVDRIYTRVGASDNVAQGESTFMVEMRETASILHGATRRSLVILDEIGRGTSTYDGLAIAWAVAEHLHDVIGCRGMFATHYHELCALAREHPGAANYNVAAKEYREDVVFLHRLVPGGANRSYGVAVAKLAGLPELVVARARARLEQLERGDLPHGACESPQPGAPRSGSQVPQDGHGQLDMFEQVAVPAPSEVEVTLRALDLDRMTPIEAMVALARLKDMIPS